MAEFTNIPYRDIAIAAITPIVLYYLALFVSIHIQAVKEGLGGIPRAEIPPISRLWNSTFIGSFVLPMVVLLVFIYVFNRSLTFASWAATTTIIGFVLLRPGKTFADRLRIICEGARTAGIEIARIGAEGGALVLTTKAFASPNAQTTRLSIGETQDSRAYNFYLDGKIFFHS